MKNLPLLFLFVFLIGCEYSVPLIQSPDKNIDRAVLGLWERTVDIRSEKLLVLPLDENEYLVSYSDRDGGMFARAGLAEVGGKTFVQIKWLGTNEGGLPDTDQVYQYATYEVNKTSLSVQMMSRDVISPEVKSTDELSKAIQENLENSDLLKEAMVFKKVE